MFTVSGAVAGAAGRYFCVGFAGLDEYHQSFVAGRGLLSGCGRRQYRHPAGDHTGQDRGLYREKDAVPRWRCTKSNREREEVACRKRISASGM